MLNQHFVPSKPQAMPHRFSSAGFFAFVLLALWILVNNFVDRETPLAYRLEVEDVGDRSDER